MYIYIRTCIYIYTCIHIHTNTHILHLQKGRIAPKRLSWSLLCLTLHRSRRWELVDELVAHTARAKRSTNLHACICVCVYEGLSMNWLPTLQGPSVLRTCMYVYAYVCMYISMYESLSMNWLPTLQGPSVLRTCMCAYVCVYIWEFVYELVAQVRAFCEPVCMYVCVYIYVYIYIYITCDSTSAPTILFWGVTNLGVDAASGMTSGAT